jgi:hypothetical protein
MILYEKTKNELNIDFNNCSTKAEVYCQCDYCGDVFLRSKRSILISRKIIQKESCGSKKCVTSKREESSIVLYGTKNFGNTPAAIEKSKKTCLEKYGVEFASCSRSVKEKIKETNLKKYGKNSYLGSKECLNAIKEKAQKLYGVDNFIQSDVVKQKRKKNNLKKHGVESPMKLPEVSLKRKNTNLKKYGKENYSQTKEYRDKRKKTCLEKYGVEHPSQLKENREKAKETCLKRYGETNYAKTKEFKDEYKKVCLEKFGVHNPLILQQNQVYGKTQNEIKDWLKSLGFSFEKDNQTLDGKELDLYNNNLKLAIEYCGLYWHNEQSPEPRYMNYHYQKYVGCSKKNIRLILIFEDEWKTKKEICKSRLKSILGIQNKIYARKCKVKKINKKEFNEFVSKNHVQGSNNLGIIYYALYYENEVIAAMSLGRHHRKKEILVLDRLCFKQEINIVGGSSKLFKTCKEWAASNGYKKIISWSDNRWSQGNIYKKLGFNLEEELGPDYYYVNYNAPKTRISKQSQSKKRTNCPEDKTEKEWCLERGLARIWDCGKKRWVFEL